MRIAYFLQTFPCLTETFVLNELLELEKDKRFEITIFSLFSDNKIIQPKSKCLKSPVTYIPDFSSIRQTFIDYPELIIKNLLTKPISTIKLFFLSLKLFKEKRLRTFYSALWLSDGLKKRKIEHLHVHFLFYNSDISLLLNMFTKIPISYTVHAHMTKHPLDTLRLKLGLAKFIITIGNYNKKILLELCPFIKNKIHIINYGIDLNEFKYNPHFMNAGRNILAVGRLVWHKGFEDLLMAAKILGDAKFKFIMTIIGDGVLKGRLLKLRKKYGLENKVFLAGSVTHDDFNKYYKSADLFVLPCISDEKNDSDGLPVSLLEAMAYGLPVISTEVANIPEAISSNEGILVPEKNPAALAEAIMKSLSENKEIINNRIQNARKKIEKEYNIVNETQKLKKLLN